MGQFWAKTILVIEVRKATDILESWRQECSVVTSDRKLKLCMQISKRISAGGVDYKDYRTAQWRRRILGWHKKGSVAVLLIGWPLHKGFYSTQGRRVTFCWSGVCRANVTVNCCYCWSWYYVGSNVSYRRQIFIVQFISGLRLIIVFKANFAGRHVDSEARSVFNFVW